MVRKQDTWLHDRTIELHLVALLLRIIGYLLVLIRLGFVIIAQFSFGWPYRLHPTSDRDLLLFFLCPIVDCHARVEVRIRKQGVRNENETNDGGSINEANSICARCCLFAGTNCSSYYEEDSVQRQGLCGTDGGV